MTKPKAIHYLRDSDCQWVEMACGRTFWKPFPDHKYHWDGVTCKQCLRMKG